MELKTCSKILPTSNFLEPVKGASCDPSESETLAQVGDYKQEGTVQSQKAAVGVIDGKVRQFHLLKLPTSEIVWVDTCAGFQECVEIISEQDVVGIDVEHRYQSMLAAIIQIATRQQIFIIDVLALTENGQVDVPTSTENRQLLSHQQGRILVTKLFANANICKLFFGRKCDVKAIAISLPGCEGLTIYKSLSNVVDLTGVYYKMRNSSLSHLLSYKVPTNIEKMKGLSFMVCQCFGAPLNEIHCGSWERRPLFPCQLSYAALDAYCLVEIYDFLRSKTEASIFNYLMQPENNLRTLLGLLGDGQSEENRGVKRKNYWSVLLDQRYPYIIASCQSYKICRFEHGSEEIAPRNQTDQQKDDVDIQVIEGDIQVQAANNNQVQVKDSNQVQAEDGIQAQADAMTTRSYSRKPMQPKQSKSKDSNLVEAEDDIQVQADAMTTGSCSSKPMQPKLSKSKKRKRNPRKKKKSKNKKIQAEDGFQAQANAMATRSHSRKQMQSEQSKSRALEKSIRKKEKKFKAKMKKKSFSKSKMEMMNRLLMKMKTSVWGKKRTMARARMEFLVKILLKS